MRSIPASLSEIEHKDGRSGAGTADHHDLVGSLLFVGEEQIAMVRLARQHPRFARATDSLLARGLHRHAAGPKRFEDRLARRDRYPDLRTCELDDKPALDGGWLGRGKVFEMHARRRPRRSGGRECFEHRRRAAAIEMRLLRCRADEARQVEHTALFLVDMEVDTVTAGSKLVQKR